MIIFLSVMDSLKLFDVAPNFVDVAFGSMTVTSLTVNNRRFERLPKDVQQVILEVAREMETLGGKVTKELGEPSRVLRRLIGFNHATVKHSC